MIKKVLFCVLCAFCVTLTSSAQKFALVDMDYSFKNIPAYERANAGVKEMAG